MMIINIENLEYEWLDVCKTGVIQKVSSFLKELGDDIEHLETNNFYLSTLCRNLKDVKIVSYLLKTYPNINVQADNNEAFVQACMNSVDMVHFLLTSEKITNHADPSAQNGLGFFIACLERKYDISKYLICNVAYFQNIDIHPLWISEVNKYEQHGYKPSKQSFLIFLIQHFHHSFFEETSFNLSFFIAKKEDTVIEAIMESFAHYDPLRYLEYLPLIKSYCQDNDAWSLYRNIKKNELQIELYIPQEEILML